MQICVFSLVFQYPNNDYISVDSQRRMLYRCHENFKNCKFQIFFFNWSFSVIYGAKLTKFGTCVVEGHLEGTVSQIFDLGPSFLFFVDIK